MADGVCSARSTSGGAARRRPDEAGRSDRSGRSGPSKRSGRPGRSSRSAGSSVTLTGRGGIVLIFGVGLMAEFLGNVSHLGFLSGFGFVAACGLAAVATRRGDLLTLVVSPPLVFLAITVVSEFIGAIGERSLPRSMFVGVITTFAAGAPWLFFGTALAIVVALPRGLPAALRALRTAPRRPAAGAATSGGVAGAAADADPGHADDDPVRWDNEAPTP